MRNRGSYWVQVGPWDSLRVQDREMYLRILGIEAPWYFERVELKLTAWEVHVYLEHRDRVKWPCPECGAECELYGHHPERQWRHLDELLNSRKHPNGTAKNAKHDPVA